PIFANTIATPSLSAGPTPTRGNASMCHFLRLRNTRYSKIRSVRSFVISSSIATTHVLYHRDGASFLPSVPCHIVSMQKRRDFSRLSLRLVPVICPLLSVRYPSRLRRRIPARESRRGPHLWPHYLRVRRRRCRRRRRRGRRPRLLRQRLAFHQQLHFVGVEHLALQQGQRDAVQRILVGVQDILRLLVSLADNPLHFAVNLQRGVFAEVAVLCDFAAQEDGLFLFAERQRPQVAHAPLADHVARDVRGAFDVVARAGG